MNVMMDMKNHYTWWDGWILFDEWSGFINKIKEDQFKGQK